MGSRELFCKVQDKEQHLKNFTKCVYLSVCVWSSCLSVCVCVYVYLCVHVDCVETISMANNQELQKW